MTSPSSFFRDIQQTFYENLSNREYDYFKSSDDKYLKLKIGYSLYGPPKTTDNYNINSDFNINTCYTKDQVTTINKIFDKLKTYGKYNEDPNDLFVSFLFNVCDPVDKKTLKKTKKKNDSSQSTSNDNTNETPYYQFPIFRVRKCSGSPYGRNCCKFVDDQLRVYQTWQDYIESNKTPKATMYVPKNGKYQGDKHDKVVLDVLPSPACSVQEKLTRVADIGTTAASLASGGIFLGAMIPAVTVAPFVSTGALITGAGVGLYSIIRSSFTLHDRRIHEQSISLADTESRNCYMNIAAGATSVITTGATKAASIALSKGVTIGENAAIALLSVNALNLTVNGCNIANSLYAIISEIVHKKKPSALDIMHLTTTVLFFSNAVVSFKSAQMIYAQTQTITFSEIIQTRSQELWMRAKQKFFSADMTSYDNTSSLRVMQDAGDICTNTASIIEKCTTVGCTVQTVVMLKDLIYDFSSVLEFGRTIIDNKDNALAICQIIIARFQFGIQEILVKLFSFLLKDVVRTSVNQIKKILPYGEKIVVYLNFIIEYLKFKTTEMEIEYQQKKNEALTNLNMSEREYESTCEVFKNAGERMLYFLKICALRMICDNGEPHEIFFREMIRFFWDWLQVKLLNCANNYDRNRSAVSHQGRNFVRSSCGKCGGYYFGSY